MTLNDTGKSRAESSTTTRGPASPDISTRLEVIVQWPYPERQYTNTRPTAPRGDCR